jgi:ribosomal protein L29
MDTKKLRKKTVKELNQLKKDLLQKFVDQSLDMRMGKMKDLKGPRKIRKDMARIETVLKEKSLDKLNNKKNGKAKV